MTPRPSVTPQAVYNLTMLLGFSAFVGGVWGKYGPAPAAMIGGGAMVVLTVLGRLMSSR